MDGEIEAGVLCAVRSGSVTDRPTKGPDGNDVYHNTSAPTYVVVGSAGAMQEERWIEPTPDWSAVRFANGAGHFYTDSYGYGSLVVGTTTITTTTLPFSCTHNEFEVNVRVVV